MMAIRNLLLCLSASVLSCKASEPEFKSLNFYNDTGQDVYIYGIKGINLYPKGKGPGNIGVGVKKPGNLSALNTTWQVTFDFPIVIEWGYDAWSYDEISNGTPPPKGKLLKIEKPKSLEGNELITSAAIVLVFGKDEQWHFDIIYGDSYVAAKTLRGVYGEK